MGLTFITSNQEKFRIADSIMKKKGIQLSRQGMELTELQSENLLEIAEYSAAEAFGKLKTAVAVTDVGFYITALRGFPGPFVKYINRYLTADNLLSLMSGIENREMIVKEYLVIIDAQSKKLVYSTQFHGKIAHEPFKSSGTSFERIFIPDGFSAPIAEASPEIQFDYWKMGSTWNAVDLKEIGALHP